MEFFDIWKSLGVLSIVLLIVYWDRNNAAWGGLTLGIIVGLVIALFSGFEWWTVGRGAILGTIIGFGAELLGKFSDKVRGKI